MSHLRALGGIVSMGKPKVQKSQTQLQGKCHVAFYHWSSGDIDFWAKPLLAPGEGEVGDLQWPQEIKLRNTTVQEQL